MVGNQMLLFFRYKAPPSGGPAEDPTPDYMNLLGMIFSMCGLMLKVHFLFVRNDFNICMYKKFHALLLFYLWLQTKLQNGEYHNCIWDTEGRPRRD